MALLGLNKEVLKRIVKTLQIKTAVEGMPLDVVQSIQPVLISNPERMIDVVKSANSGGTIFTTPTDKDFYLTSVYMTGSSSAAGSNDTNTMNIFLESGEEVTVVILGIKTSGTAGDSVANSISREFNIPIKLKKGSIISITQNTATGASGLSGYTVEGED